MERKTYQWCVVPQCRNTSISTPNRLFIDVPRKADIRKKWLDLAKKQYTEMSIESPIYFCEDHFDLPNDMENYMRYHIMGYVKKIILKPGCIPSKFECQSDRKRNLPLPSASSSNAIKKQRVVLTQEAREQTNQEKNTLDLLTEIKVKYQPCEQGQFKSKFNKSIATSPYKPRITTTSTLPFQVEGLKEERQPSKSVLNITKKFVDPSHSNLILFYNPSTSSSPSSAQSLPCKILSNSSINLKDVQAKIEKERETKPAMYNMCKNISAKPFLYIGLPKECYYLVDLLHANTNIPTEHILLCLKKIRLNTSFPELADQFGVSEPHAGKIFQKYIPIISNHIKLFIAALVKERFLPIAFRHCFNKVSCIIECFEIKIDKPEKSFKGNTIKYLISCTLNGLVSYVSSGYAGQIKESLLVETCGFLEQLKPGSCIVADRKFKQIEELLIQKQCCLLKPPSETSSAIITKQEVRITKQINILRTHIEQVIQRIREFSMLKLHSELNSKLICMLDDCVLIACGLINLQNRIVQ